MLGTLKDCLANEDGSAAVTTNDQEKAIIVEQHQNFMNGSWFWFLYPSDILLDFSQWDTLTSYDDLIDALAGDPDPDESRWTKTTRNELKIMLDYQAGADELRKTLPDLSPEEALLLAKESAKHW